MNDSDNLWRHVVVVFFMSTIDFMILVTKYIGSERFDLLAESHMTADNLGGTKSMLRAYKKRHLDI